MFGGHLNAVELVGYLASLLVFSTFYMKTMFPLRIVAIASNVVFLTYGFLAGLYPVFLLHSILLPLNSLRLYQMRQLLIRVRRASSSTSTYSVEGILPFMTQQKVKKGEIIFHRGDTADRIYFLVSGSVWFPEIKATAQPGDLFGEIGVFSPGKTRTASAMASSDSVLMTLSEEKVVELYYQSPEFGFYLVRVIIQNLTHQVKAASPSAEA